jgi:hypothetical protein
MNRLLALLVVVLFAVAASGFYFDWFKLPQSSDDGSVISIRR